MFTASLILALACADGSQSLVEPDTPSSEATKDDDVSFVVSPSQMRIPVARQKQVEARVLDRSGREVSGFTVTWESADPLVAEVDGEGTVRGNGASTVEVRAEAVRESGGEVLVGSVEVEVVGDMKPVRDLEISPESSELEPGDTERLTATPKDQDGEAQNRPVKWSSSDVSVATVDDSGTVTALTKGDADILAESGGMESSARVTVISGSTGEDVSVASVEVAPASTSLEVGESASLEATVKGSDGEVLERSVEWTSSDAAVASVDAGGTVTAEGEGEATITATTGEESGTAAVSASVSDESSFSGDLSGRPNEPAGYSVVFDWDMGHALPPWMGSSVTSDECRSVAGLSQGGARRSWSGSNVDRVEDISLSSAADAPESGSSVMRARLAEGLLAGQRGTRETIHVWSGETGACSHGPGRQGYDEVYAAWWMRTEADDHEYRGVRAGLKIPGSVALYDEAGDGTGSVTFMVAGSEFDYADGGPYKVRFTYEDLSGARRSEEIGAWNGPNPSQNFTFGQWHRVEVVMKRNSLRADGSPVADGIFKMWLDDVIVLDLTDRIYRTGAHDGAFSIAWLNFSYGGGDMETTKERDDFWLMDRVYTSGKPQ